MFLDDVPVGQVLDRRQESYEVSLLVKKGQKLTLLVESLGRIGYGPDINDFKVSKQFRK